MNSRSPFVVLSVYGLLVVVMAILIDWGVSGSISNFRIIGLYSHSQGNLASLESELVELGQTVKALEVVVEEQFSTVTPTLDNFRQLAADHRLRFRQLERINSSNPSMEYSAALRGRIGAVVGFLKDLEDNFRLDANYVLIKPANVDGSLVELTLQLETAGP